jgi:hypothetical protein
MLWDARIASRFGARFAKLAATGTTLLAVIAMPFVARSSRGDGSAGLVVTALAWLTWLAAGPVALSAANRSNDAEDGAITALAASRGYPAAWMSVARSLAVARRIRQLVGIPALLLSLGALGFSRTLVTLGARALTVGTVAGYVFVLSAILGLTVHLARALTPDRPRTLFLALIVVPHFARLVFPSLPSVPSVLGALLHHLVVPGAGR